MREFHLRQIQHLKKELEAIQTIKDFNLHRYKVLQIQKIKIIQMNINVFWASSHKQIYRPTLREVWIKENEGGSQI